MATTVLQRTTGPVGRMRGTGLAKADWQRRELRRHQRRFLTALRDEADEFLAEALAAVEGGLSRLRLPLGADGLAAFARLTDVLTDGWERGHGVVLRYVRGRVQKAVEVAPGMAFEEGLAMPPPEFIARYRRRELRLAGVYESARLDWVQGIIARGAREGWGVVDTRKQLETRFGDWNRRRLNNIARTESSLLYTHGEFARMTGSPFVTGFEFSAVMDERTSDMCAARHGHHYAKGEHIDCPPLHFQCRSELLPIFEDEKLRVRALPADAPAPLEGFGAPPEIQLRIAP